jgi:hypothetical protein
VFIELLHAGGRAHKHAESRWTDNQLPNTERRKEGYLTKLTGYAKNLTFKISPS